MLPAQWHKFHLGKSIVGVRLPCTDAAGNTTLQIVTATVVSAIPPSIYRLSYPFNAITSTFDVDKTLLERYLAESDARIAAAGAVNTISIPSTFNVCLSGVLKSMPKSNALSDTVSSTVLDIRETFAVLAVMAPATIGAMTLPAIISPTSDKNLLEEMGDELERINDKFPNATIAMARTFTSAPGRLGNDFLAFIANPAGPSASISNHPRAERFRLAAKSTVEWDDFLLKSVESTFTCANRRASAVTAGEYVMKGGLDRYILSGKEVASLYLDNNLGSNLSSSQLLDVLFGMADAIEDAAASSSSMGSGGASGALVPMPTAFGGTHMPPIHLHVPVANHETSTEADNRLVNQLRADAFVIQHDASAQKTLKGLMLIKDTIPEHMFIKTIKTIDDERLLRLLNQCTDKDYTSILQGGFEDLGLQLSSIRTVIERQLEKFIFGEQSSEPPERVTKAFRNARLGRIDKLKLFHLVDIDDSGTPAAPLAALVKIQDRSVAFEMLSESLDRLQQILCITYPNQINQTMQFMPKFKTELKKIIVDKNVAWPSVTAWFKAITQKISRPALRHSLAEGVWGGPKFQLEWLKESCDYNHDLQEAKLEALAHSILGKRGIASITNTETASITNTNSASITNTERASITNTDSAVTTNTDSPAITNTTHAGGDVVVRSFGCGAESTSDQSDGSLASEDDSDNDLADDSGTGEEASSVDSSGAESASDRSEDSDNDLADDGSTGEEASSVDSSSAESASDQSDDSDHSDRRI